VHTAAIATWLDTWIWVPVTGAVGVHVFLLFPTGRPPSPRWRWVLWTGTLGIVVFSLAFAIGEDLEQGFANPFFDVGEEVTGPSIGLGALLYLGSVAAAAVSLIVRYRRALGDERQQLRWFAAAAALVALSLTVVFLGELVFTEIRAFGRIGEIGVVVSFLSIPVATGIAVLKYRLYELDVVISKAVLYGALVAIITLLYVGIVVGIGAAVGSRGNVLLSILATAIIALAFQPVRRWASHLANRVVYGKRATPYEVLAEFAEGLGSLTSVEDVLPRLARLLGEGTGSDTGVWIHVGQEFRLTAAWPQVRVRSTSVPTSSAGLPAFDEWDRAYPVQHRGEVLGALTVTKPPQEPLTGSEEHLIENVASQAGLVMGNVRLIEELRASRQRLVTAQDQERRRLERNIHDGAQQQLVALTVKMRLLRGLARKDPEAAEGLVDQLQDDSRDALDNLRDLARGIYPPLLADQGLAAAVEAQARKAVISVEVRSDGVGRYPQEAEATAYFCVLEALQNVAKYADATRTVVRLEESEGYLVFSVADDGAGFDVAATPRGAGLQNMADRIEAVGGSLEVASAAGRGTTITGRIPAVEVGS
jgi:signal transduction histidine kinase